MRTIASLLSAAVILVPCLAICAPPPASPGMPIGQTEWDLQHNESMGRQVGRAPGSDIVHFTWMAKDRVDQGCLCDPYRSVAYNTFNIATASLFQGFGGVFVGLGSLSNSGFSSLAVDAGNSAHVTLHQVSGESLPRRAWHLGFPTPGNSNHVDVELMAPDSNTGDMVWPQVDVQRLAGQTIVHELAREGFDSARELLFYWRYDGNMWSGPALIDSTWTSGYVIAADPNSQLCTILLHSFAEPQFNGLNNVAFYTSQTAGIGWLNGSELGLGNKQFITNYSSASGPAAGYNISAAYNNDGVLQVVWDEVMAADEAIHSSIMHWNPARGAIRTAVNGHWNFGQWYPEHPLDKVTIGIGDGSTTCGGTPNRDFLYVVYTRLGGTTQAEQEDQSLEGRFNGELYLNVSGDGGNSWDQPTNLTNTKTPNCNPGPADTTTRSPLRPDSVCRSENWASINKVVHDIDILFISDMDAGAAPLGEGTWQLNPVHYLRIPGVAANSSMICPSNATQVVSTYTPPESDLCGVHASGADTVFGAALSVHAFGGIPVSGRVRVVYTNPATPIANWLSLDGQQVAFYTLDPLGESEWISEVWMAATSLPRGTYSAEIRVEPTDSTLPPYAVQFITFNVNPCGCYGDPVCDEVSNVQDVIAVVDAAFRGSPESLDPFCFVTPIGASGVTDVDCSGSTSVVDVVKTVDVCFRSGDPALKFCHPCSQPITAKEFGLRQSSSQHRPVF